jgi:curli biogenesis system outer membrane secretion channel CsgG
MSTICSMIQGCAAPDHFKVDIHKSKGFSPSQEVKVGVLTFTAPAAGVSKYSPFGPEGEYSTPANVGVSVADAVSYELMKLPNIILILHSQLEQIFNEHKLSLGGVANDPDFLLLGQILPVDALIFGNVTTFQLWNDMAGHGGIVAYSARLVNIHTTEVLFTIRCSAVKRGGVPGNIVNDLSRAAIKKLLEK